MAITGTDRGTGGRQVGATTIVITPGSNFAALSSAVLCVAYDNSGASGVDPYTSISDSVSNTWSARQDGLYNPGGSGNTGVVVRIFESAMLVAKLTTGNTITISFGAVSVPAVAWTLMEVLPSVGYSLKYLTGAVNTGAATGTPTVTTSSINSGCIVVGAGASESSNTWAGDADSTNGTWSTHQTAGSGGAGASAQAVTSQRKVVTATATQTYNPTLTSADCILAWISMGEVPPVSSWFVNLASPVRERDEILGY